MKEDRISSVVQKQLTHLVTQPTDAAAWKSKTQLDAILEADGNELMDEKADSSLGSVKSVHQVVTLDMSSSPTHPHLEVRPT